eukprot:jgi/Picre1/27084/NNA_000054.t1
MKYAGFMLMAMLMAVVLAAGELGCDGVTKDCVKKVAPAPLAESIQEKMESSKAELEKSKAELEKSKAELEKSKAELEKSKAELGL